MSGDSLSGETGWEIDMDFLRRIEQEGGLLIDHIPKIGDTGLIVNGPGPDGEKFRLIFEVSGIRRTNDAGTHFTLELEGFPIGIPVRLSDSTKAAPVSGPYPGMIQPKLFRPRARPTPSSSRPPTSLPAIPSV